MTQVYTRSFSTYNRSWLELSSNPASSDMGVQKEEESEDKTSRNGGDVTVMTLR